MPSLELPLRFLATMLRGIHRGDSEPNAESEHQKSRWQGARTHDGIVHAITGPLRDWLSPPCFFQPGNAAV